MELNKHVTFDIDTKLNRYLTAKSLDTTSSRSFIFKIIKNNSILNLKNLTIKIAGKKPDGKDVLIDCKIINESDGLVEFELTTQMLLVAGFLDLELVFYKDFVELSSMPFLIHVVKSARDNKSIESSNEYNSLVNLLIKVDEWDKYFNDTSSKIEEKYTNRLNEKTSVKVLNENNQTIVKNLIFKVTDKQSSGTINNVKVSPNMGLKLI